MSGQTTAVPIALLHMCPALGEVQANLSTLQSMASDALKGGAKFVVAPELATTGYCITADEVEGGLGFRAPFSEFGPLQSLASQYQAYIALGFAEIADDGKLYNSAILLKPDGTYYVQRKRGVALWNAMGNTPFEAVETPYGKVGLVICSDTYLMAWARILCLDEADIVLAPANWWGQAQQLDIWRARTLENGVFFLVANRWGIEVDTRFPPNTYTYNMNDAPSAIVDMDGNVLLSFQMNSTPKPYANKLLAYTIDVPTERITTPNDRWSLINRVERAFVSLANQYYVRDTGNKPMPGLPQAGTVNAGAMPYVPVEDSTENLATIQSMWSGQSTPSDVLLLPPNGLTTDEGLPDPSTAPWSTLVQFVVQNGIQLLATSALVPPSPAGGSAEQALVTITGDGALTVTRPVNEASNQLGELRWPVFVDVGHGRVGVILGSDDFFPEMGVSLAKKGADILVAPVILPPPPSTDAVEQSSDMALIQTRNNDVVHIVTMTNSAEGFILVNGGGFIKSKDTVDTSTGMQVIALDTALVRTKFLNTYYEFDLETLIGEAEYPSASVDLADARMKAVGEIQERVRQVDVPQHDLPPGLSHPVFYTPGDRILGPDD